MVVYKAGILQIKLLKIIVGLHKHNNFLEY
jgi:hypothetical protein